jgi:hypothetical protein
MDSAGAGIDGAGAGLDASANVDTDADAKLTIRKLLSLIIKDL